MRTCRRTIARRVQAPRGGFRGRRMMESAGLPACYAPAASQLTPGVLRLREQRNHRGGAEKQDQRQADDPDHITYGLSMPAHLFEYTTLLKHRSERKDHREWMRFQTRQGAISRPNCRGLNWTGGGIRSV